MITRRTFIAAGIAGGATLAAAYWWRTSPFASMGGAALGEDAATIIAAIAPAMLADALPQDEPQRARAIADTVAGVRTAVAGLPPAARHELDQLFALLAFAPARIALARVTSSWSQATSDEVGAFLERWRTSRMTLLRSAYDALHQLVFAAWYGQEDSWAAIGYPGPPRLTS